MERKITIKVKPYEEAEWRDEELNTFHEWFDDYVELYGTADPKLKGAYTRYFNAWFGQCCPGHRDSIIELDQPCCFCNFGPEPYNNLDLQGEPCAMCATNHELLALRARYQEERGRAPG